MNTVIVGANRQQLVATLQFGQFKPYEQKLLDAYTRREIVDVGPVILLCRAGRRWALVCPMVHQIKDFKQKVKAISPRVAVMPHNKFIADPKWRKVVKVSQDL